MITFIGKCGADITSSSLQKASGIMTGDVAPWVECLANMHEAVVDLLEQHEA